MWRADLTAIVRPGHGDNSQDYPHFPCRTCKRLANRPTETDSHRPVRPAEVLGNGRHTGGQATVRAPRPLGVASGSSWWPTRQDTAWRLGGGHSEMKGSAPLAAITGSRCVSEINRGSPVTLLIRGPWR
ncbi:uncharacterized protein BDW43DRAFT_240666 [Aspergillus alliaceus]|uniref:uncharacterized protein n=1 Tax=Petromyces alliaceus TaxID=209559 RepID=UPI0012A5E8E0|nr:uncharacterized protein BDW43DRAFT_240666 [Aspergillus alliaceus]KAB8236571.1 hypothetical protein BDW43DRAFT_240666 [Aspergillus alliaceus]